MLHCRCETYKSILNAFDNLYAQSSNHSHPLPMHPGPPPRTDPNALTAEQAKQLVSKQKIKK